MKVKRIMSLPSKLAGRLAIIIGLASAMPVLAETSETPSSSPVGEFGVEVLSLFVSKLARDAFGNAVNPFSGMGFNQGKAGTLVFAEITP